MLVNANPVIDTEPEDMAICEDGTVVFSADASGPDLVYQWYVDRQDGNGFVALTDDCGAPGIQHGPDYADQCAHFTGWMAVQAGCVQCLSVPCPHVVNPYRMAQPDTGHIPQCRADFPNFPLICGGDVLTLDGNPTSGSGTYSLHQWTGDYRSSLGRRCAGGDF